MKHILLTFDIEKLGLSSYGLRLENSERYSLSLEGFKRILAILDKNNIKATFFFTADLALKYKTLLKEISKKHEISSHGLDHKDNYLELDDREIVLKIKKSKEIIEKIIEKKIYGFRAPRFQFIKYGLLDKIGLKYDSSLNPTFYKTRNLFAKRKIFSINSITEIPVSVTPLFRLPLFWLAFRNLGLSYAKMCTKLCFTDSNYVMTLFHPWEFIDLSGFRLPFYIKRNSGKKLEKMLDEYIKWCLVKGYKFETISEYLNKNLS